MNSGLQREPKARRHSVLDDLRARRDSLFQRARRSSIFEEKEKVQKTEKEHRTKDKQQQQQQRRSSDGNSRRGSVFYVTDNLVEENHQVLETEDETEMEIIATAKKARRKSWHPVAKLPKLERKRKKGVIASNVPSEVANSTEVLVNPRQKRLSWWNIFVPDSVGRYLLGRINFIFSSTLIIVYLWISFSQFISIIDID